MPSFPRFFAAALFALASALWISAASAQDSAPLPDYVIEQFGEPPAIPTGQLSDIQQATIKTAFIDSVAQSTWENDQTLAIIEISESQDPRLVWIISDLMRFATGGELTAIMVSGASKLLGKEMAGPNPWGTITDHLIAWDIPAPPDYLSAKRAIFTSIVPGWDKIFVEGSIDWRMVS